MSKRPRPPKSVAPNYHRGPTQPPKSQSQGEPTGPNGDATATKDQLRRLVYQRLRKAKAARFPFPIEGRIPNFKGAEAAARRLRDLDLYQQAKALKINPDAPQLPIRTMALKDGKVVYMPSPRLRGAFLCLRPEAIPPGEERKAASLSYCHLYGEEVALEALQPGSTTYPPIQLVITGSVAVTRDGRRAGKGEGYGDLEYALLRELGYPPLPVITTVHPVQIVDDIPVEPYDLIVDVIVTPDEVIFSNSPYPKPEGIDWSRLGPEDLEAMPILKELRQLKWEKMTVDDVLGDNLAVLFVGLNPGRASAGSGHHFAGPNNFFWRLLYEAGFTPRRLEASDDRQLPRYGLGITNLIQRATRGESDLTWDEMLANGTRLRAKVAAVRPRIVALLGKQVYRAYAGLSRSARLQWGLQPVQTVPGVMEFLAPNPSSRSTIPYSQRLELFRELYRLSSAPQAP